MFRRRLSLVLALLVVASMLLAACGGGAEPTPVPPTEPPAAAAPTDTPVPPPPTDTPVPPTDTPVPEVSEPVTVTEVVTPTEPPTPEPTALPTPFVTKDCPAGSPTLTIWADDTRAPVFYDISGKVLEETGVCLNVQEVGFGDIRSKSNLQAPAGEGPDIFVGAHDWLGELTANGVVAELDLGAKTADFDPVALEAFTYNGMLYGMPYAVENVAFVCNSDLVATPPTTYDEVQSLSQEAMDAGTVKQWFALMGSDPYHQEPINTAFGGYIFAQTDTGYDACDVGLDSQGAIDYLTWIDTMVKAGLLSADVDWETAHVLFETGQAGCMITGPWALDRIRNNNINYTINPVPGEAEDGSPFVGVQGFMVNAFSPNKVLAQTFLTDYVATNEVMEPIYTSGNRPPAYLPAREVMDDDAKAFAAAAEAAHPMPAIPAMSAVWDAWGAAITTVFQQSATPADAAANAAKQVRAAAGCQ